MSITPNEYQRGYNQGVSDCGHGILRLTPMDEAKDGEKHVLALAQWTCDEYDEDGRIVRKGVVTRDWVVVYRFLGTWTTFPYTGSFPKNVEYLGWLPLPDVKRFAE